MLMKKLGPAPAPQSQPARGGEIGFPIRFQQKFERILQDNHDSVIEVGEEDRRFHRYLPTVLREAKDSACITHLVIVGTAEEVTEVEDYARLLLSSSRNESPVVGIGVNPNVRKENLGLGEKKSILVGIPERIIDHLRRGNLDLAKVERVVIDCPSEKNLDGFIADIQFIYSRTGFKPNTCVLIAAIRPEAESIYGVLKNPRIHPKERWMEPIKVRLSLADDSSEGKITRILRHLKAESQGSRVCLVVAESRGSALTLKRSLEKSGAPVVFLGEAGESPGKDGVEILLRSAFSAERAKKSVKIVFTFPPSPSELEAAGRSDEHDAADILIVIRQREYPAFSETQEKITLNVEKHENPNEEAVIKGFIESMIQKIKTDENPQELNYYRKVFKKNVSIFLRSYFAAYLLKQMLEEGGAVDKRKRPVLKNSQRQEMATLFFGLGKNRKVYPRDITQLISGVPDVEKASIGEIKILDNYSFVEIAESHAQKVIDALNGMDYRGRKITVNFARKREEPQAPDSPQSEPIE